VEKALFDGSVKRRILMSGARRRVLARPRTDKGDRLARPWLGLLANPTTPCQNYRSRLSNNSSPRRIRDEGQDGRAGDNERLRGGGGLRVPYSAELIMLHG
jgi:hypothetical protein